MFPSSGGIVKEFVKESIKEIAALALLDSSIFIFERRSASKRD